MLALLSCPACRPSARDDALSAIRSSNVADRIEGLYLIASLASPELSRSAVRLLDDLSPRVRLNALNALDAGGIVDDYLSAIVRRLSDTSPGVALRALELIANSTTATSEKVLLNRLDSPQSFIREAVASALVARGISRRSQRERIGRAKLQRWLEAAISPSAARREEAIANLTASGRMVALQAIARLLYDPVVNIALSAGHALGRVDNSWSRAALDGAALHPSPVTRQAVHVGRLESRGSYFWLHAEESLKAPRPDVRLVALKKLVSAAETGRLRSTDVPHNALSKVLCALMAGPVTKPDQIEIVATALRGSRALNLNCGAVIQRLTKTIATLSPSSMDSGSSFLAQMNVLRLIPLDSARSLLLRRVRNFVEIYREARRRWLDLRDWRELAGIESDPRQRADRGISQARGSRRDINWLLARYPVGQSGLRGVSLLPGTTLGGLPALVERLEATHPPTLSWLIKVAAGPRGEAELVRSAVRALSRLKRWRGAASERTMFISALQKILKADDLDGRAATISALHLMPGGATIAQSFLEAGAVEIRAAAATVLARMKVSSAFPMLIRLFDTEPEIVFARALAMFQRRESAAALARFLDRRGALSSSGVERAEIVDLLAKLPYRSPEVFWRELSHPRWQVRLAAVRALKVRFEQSQPFDVRLTDRDKTRLDACLGDYYQTIRTACAELATR